MVDRTLSAATHLLPIYQNALHAVNQKLVIDGLYDDI